MVWCRRPRPPALLRQSIGRTAEFWKRFFAKSISLWEGLQILLSQSCFPMQRFPTLLDIQYFTKSLWLSPSSPMRDCVLCNTTLQLNIFPSLLWISSSLIINSLKCQCLQHIIISTTVIIQFAWAGLRRKAEHQLRVLRRAKQALRPNPNHLFPLSGDICWLYEVLAAFYLQVKDFYGSAHLHPSWIFLQIIRNGARTRRV